MDKLPMCRICLAKNVRMYVVVNKKLQALYEKLTDVPFVTEDSRPMFACFICCTLLKKCYRLQEKCRKAEELFAQILNEDYELRVKPLINQDHLKLFHGFIKTQTENINMVEVAQTKSVVVKEELPAVCDEQQEDLLLKPKEEPLSDDDLETASQLNNYLEIECILPHHSKSQPEDDVPLMEFKTELGEEQEELGKAEKTNLFKIPSKNAEKCKKYRNRKKEANPKIKKATLTSAERSRLYRLRKRQLAQDIISPVNEVLYTPTTWDSRMKFEPSPQSVTTDLETASQLNNYLDIECTPPHHSESQPEDDVPLMEFKTEYGEEQEELGKAVKTYHIDTDIRKNYVEIEYIPPHQSGTEDDEILMQLSTEVEEEPEEVDKKRRTKKRNGTSVATKPKLDARRTKPEDTVAAEVKNSDHTITQNPQISSDPENYGIDAAEKPYKCDVCLRSFRLKRVLNVHIRQHTGKRPYTCDVCQHSFRVRGELTLHIRTHTGEKPYECDVCQRSFSRKDNLSKHYRIHTGERPYTCGVCQRSFRLKGDHTVHIRQHTGEKPYRCVICQRGFRQNSDLTKHVRIHTGEKPYNCDVCQRGFSRQYHLSKHVQQLHSSEKAVQE